MMQDHHWMRISLSYRVTSENVLRSRGAVYNVRIETGDENAKSFIHLATEIFVVHERRMLPKTLFNKNSVKNLDGGSV